ncbi:protein of unknown function [Nitrospira japonica]|uniref:Uncharacterized protein n=1 Tax=Nitrospira japonica TaxID=1325564 RepID=A0A1W1I542_9BACT|nr:protein of unknown function [Nitrospira japonica]
MYEGDKWFDLVVRFLPEFRRDIDSIGQILVQVTGVNVLLRHVRESGHPSLKQGTLLEKALPGFPLPAERTPVFRESCGARMREKCWRGGPIGASMGHGASFLRFRPRHPRHVCGAVRPLCR